MFLFSKSETTSVNKYTDNIHKDKDMDIELIPL